jgi:hypothetical protein
MNHSITSTVVSDLKGVECFFGETLQTTLLACGSPWYNKRCSGTESWRYNHCGWCGGNVTD